MLPKKVKFILFKEEDSSENLFVEAQFGSQDDINWKDLGPVEKSNEKLNVVRPISLHQRRNSIIGKGTEFIISANHLKNGVLTTSQKRNLPLLGEAESTNELTSNFDLASNLELNNNILPAIPTNTETKNPLNLPKAQNQSLKSLKSKKLEAISKSDLKASNSNLKGSSKNQVTSSSNNLNRNAPSSASTRTSVARKPTKKLKGNQTVIVGTLFETLYPKNFGNEAKIYPLITDKQYFSTNVNELLQLGTT